MNYRDMDKKQIEKVRSDLRDELTVEISRILNEFKDKTDINVDNAEISLQEVYPFNKEEIIFFVKRDRS